MNQRDDILQRITSVPALPVAAIKAISILQDTNADLSEISRVISHDPALAANVLKLANSALFGSRQETTTIDTAVMRLGTRHILDLVVGSAVKPIASKPIDGYDLPAGELWKHSIAVACGTDELAGVLGIPAPHGAFTAGLLIDIGKHVMGTQLEIDGQAICTQAFESGISFEEAERTVLGIDHAEVGAHLLEHWGVPSSLVCAARWHHDPDGCPPEHRVIVSLVHASDQICTLSGIGAGVDGCHYKPCESVIEELKIDERVIESTLCRIVERLDAVRDIMDLSTGGT